MKKNISLIVLFSVNIFAMEKPLRPSLKQTFSVEQPDYARFTSDGQRLVLGSAACKFFVYDTSNFSQPKVTIPVKYNASPIDLNPANNNEVAVGSAFLPVSLYDITTAQKTGYFPVETENPWSLQYSNNGDFLVLGGQKGCAIWDVRTKEIAKTITDQQGAIAKFNPKDNNFLISSTIASVTQKKGCVLSFLDRRNTDKPLHSITTEVPLYDLNYDNEGKKLVCSASSQFIIYDAKDAALIAYYTKLGKKSPDNKPVHVPANKGIRYADTLQFMPDQNDVFVAGLDTGDLVVCNLKNDNDSMHFAKPHNECQDIFALRISPDSRTMISSFYEADQLFVWDISAIEEKVKAKIAGPNVVPVSTSSRWCSLQ